MLYDKIYNFIKQNNLITEDTVICAVSGGADSVCLLDVMTNIASKLGVKVECAHLNHNLRGKESDGDEQYVKTLCEKYSVPFHSKSVDVLKDAKGMSIEEAARRVRYEFFDELTANRNARILTAHTVNDNTETFFINLIRGSGSRGLCGIPLVRGNVSRPLLCVQRAEIIEHLSKIGLEYRTDSTNSDTAYLRNFIRHEIIPRFSEREGLDIHQSVSRAMQNLCSENEALTAYVQKIDSDSVTVLSGLPDALLYRVLNSRLEKKFDITLDSVHFNAVKGILKNQNSRVQIRGNLFAINSYGKLSFEEVMEKNTDEMKLVAGDNEFCGKSILIKNSKEIYNTLTNYYIDCDKICNGLYVRTRRDGDVFYHSARKVTSSLKKLLINDKVEKSVRDRLAVICDGNGDIVFVEGYGADARFKAEKMSKNIIGITIRGKIENA